MAQKKDAITDTNPAAKAAQEILNLATHGEGKELTEGTRDKLFSKCEATIRANVEGFYAVGVALEAIRRNDLYKLAGFKTFEAYCEARWNFGRARASQLIKAAGIVNNCKQSGLPPPTNEAQTRELGKLKTPEQQVTVWKQITNKSPLAEITAPKVAKAVATKLKPAQKSKEEASSATPEHKADENADEARNATDAGAEEEDAAESVTDTGDVVHDEENSVEASSDAVADDDACVPVEADAAAEDDSPISLYRQVLEELPGALDKLVDQIDDIAGQAMESESATELLGRIAIKIEILREAEEALAGVPA